MFFCRNFCLKQILKTLFRLPRTKEYYKSPIKNTTFEKYFLFYFFLYHCTSLNKLLFLLTKMYVIMMSIILKTIRLTRIEKNLTQEAVAKKLNFTQSYYAKMENGKADITLCNLLKLIEVLEVDYFIFQKRIERRIQENDI